MHRSIRGRRVLLAAAGLFILAQGAAVAADPLRLTKPVQITKDDINPGRLYLAPALAVDPANPMHVAAGVTELRTKTCTFMRSKDGGQTWQRPEASPAPNTFPFCNTNNRGAFQGQVAFGRDSNLYYAFPGWDESDGGTRGNSSVLVARSDDLGDSWTTEVARNNRGKQGEQQEYQRPIGSIAVDSRSGSADSVYVGYTTRLTGFTGPNSAPNITTVLASTDGGRTWGEPRVLQENVGKQNVMSVTFRRLKPNATAGPLGLFYLVKNGPADQKMYLRVSADEAKTFGEPVCATDGPGYHVMNNDRVTVLSNGRLVCPVSWTDDVFKKGGGHFVSFCYFS
ncbi:MAG TPA: sialidase family protein, partial [Acidimicrobiales bacterium]